MGNDLKGKTKKEYVYKFVKIMGKNYSVKRIIWLLILFIVFDHSNICEALFEDLGSEQDVTVSSQPIINVVSALNSAQSMSSSQKALVYRELRKQNYFSSSEVQATYESMKSEEKNSEDRQYVNNMRNLGFALSKATNEAEKPVVAKLLSDEIHALPQGYFGPLSGSTEGAARKENSRYFRLEGLLKAASDGHNQLAIPAIKELSQRDDLAGQLAVQTLQQMGESDLDEMISRIKSDPYFKTNLAPYGTAGLQRVIAEIHSGNTNSNTHYQLLEKITDSYGHDAVPIYVKLLNDPSPDIQKTAARGLAKAVNSSDSETIQLLIKNRNPEIRLQGILAIDNSAWSPKYVNTLISTLEKDSDPAIRCAAMDALGKHKVYSAIPALEIAVHYKQSGLVRGAARATLTQLNQR